MRTITVAQLIERLQDQDPDARVDPMTLKQVREAISADTYSSKHGVFTIRKGFFYTHGFGTSQFEEQVRKAFPTAIILDSGEVWKAFRGGATTAQGSHWFVKFTFSGMDYRWADDARCAR